MRITSIGFLIACLALCVSLKAQPPQKFYTTMGAEGDEVAFSCKQTLDGSYIIAGSSTSYGTNGLADMYLVKVNIGGFPDWTRFIGGPGIDAASAIIQIPDSGYVLAGYTNSFLDGGYDVYLVRTDKYGDTIWTRTWGAGNGDWEFATDLVWTPDSGIIVVGHSIASGTGNTDAVMLKYKLDGTLNWQKLYGGPQNDEFRAVIVTNDSSIGVVGFTESSGDINGDGWFLKLNLNGDTIFKRTFGGPFRDSGNDLVQKNNSDFVIAGAKTFVQGGPTHSYMLSLDASGAFLWDNNYYHSSSDEEYVGVALSNHLSTHTAFLKNIPVPDFGTQGNIFVSSPGGWAYIVNSFGGDQEEHFTAIEGTADGGYIIVGKTNSFNSKGIDIFFMKFDSTVSNYVDAVSIGENEGFSNQVCYFDNRNNSIVVKAGNQSGCQATLFDMTGRVLAESALSDDETRIDCALFPADFYILRIGGQNCATSYRKLGLFR